MASNMNSQRFDNRFGANHDVLTVPGFESPPSPPASYDNKYPPDNEKIGPPLLHFQLPETLPDKPIAENQSDPETLPQPPQPTLNHLYVEQGNTTLPVLAFRTNYRFREKIVTMVYFRTVPRQASTSRARWP